MEILDRPKLLYLFMVIAAVAVTVFSLLGIVALSGVLPSAHSEIRDAAAAGIRADKDRMTPKKLAEIYPSCGTVESERAAR